jgi:hypothetical protein
VKQKALSHCHAVLSMIAAGLVLSGLGDMVPGLPHQFAAQTVQAASSHKSITLDVAIDCRTWRFNGGTSFEGLGRGDSFLADGRIFPAGTLGAGAQSNDPNDPGSIGKWTQRGTMAATLAEIVSGTRPAFFATWFHFLDDGSGLVVDGPHPESGPMAVVGGMGRFSGASGELSDEIIGTNNTGCPNLRLTITLKKQARE